MAICGVVASESLLTYNPSTLRSGHRARSARPRKYCHGPTASALCALHLTIPEQAPINDEELQDGLDTLDGVFDDVDGVRDSITEMEIEEEAGGFV